MADIKSALQQYMARSTQTHTSASGPVVQLLDEWAQEHKPETTMTQTPTPTPSTPALSISEQTFNLVRDNPYISVTDAVKQLKTRGHLASTTTSLISQMVRSGMMSRDKDNSLSALQKKYTPIQAAPARAHRKERAKANRVALAAKRQERDIRVKVRNAASEGIATLTATRAQAAPFPSISPDPTPTLLTAKQVLETLSIKEAHMLYRELQTMFGD
jgi:hypothetical protein